jgi:hypothetical protein
MFFFYRTLGAEEKTRKIKKYVKGELDASKNPIHISFFEDIEEKKSMTVLKKICV